MSNQSPKTRRVTALILSVTLSNFAVFNASPILAAKNLENAKTPAGILNAGNAKANTNVKNTTQQVGQLIVTGTVTVNEKKAITGTTVFTDSRIAVACAKGNSAIVNLGKLGRIELSSGTKMLLRFSDGLISGDLLEGKAVVSSPAGVKVAVNTPDGVSSADGAEAAVTPVVTQRGVRCVPVAVGSSSSSVLGNGALAAILVGIGGGVAAAAAVASVEDNATPTTPPIGSSTNQ
jgi:hypothetical protein